ncbi:MAG: HD domain-containing protein [Candidatus Bathyarchaeia archaeon]
MALIRGYVLPKRGPDNSPVYAESIDDKSAGRMFEELADLVRGVLDAFTNNGDRKITSPSELSLFLDSLVAYFKSLVFIDPIPPEAGFSAKILPVSLQALYLYLSRRELLSKSGVKPYSKEGLNRLEEVIKYAGETAKLYSDEKRRKFYDVIRFPADTRPGPNTSSLLIHSLTASALASTYYINKNGMGENLTVVRLAAIFHDIGKLLDWQKHEEVSSKKLEELFDMYIDGYARKLVSEASELISNNKHPLREFLNYGDRNSSELDRVVTLFFKVIRNSPLYKDLENCLKDYGKAGFEEAYNDWIFWDNYVKEDLVKRLTEEFCKRASMMDEENPIFAEEGKIIDENVIFIRIDVRRIQQFIKVNNLWAMNGASRLIDMILYVGIPAYLVDVLNLPLENILYFGGGNETLVLPRGLIGENKERIHLLAEHFNNEFFKGSSSRIVFGASPFYSNFRSINSEIDRELAAKKIRYDGQQDVNPNIYEICDFCGRAPATQLSDKEERICTLCGEKLQFGGIQHFRARSDFLGLNWKELSNYVIEYIAGHSTQGPKPGEEYLNLSMVKFDGMLIGQIMSSSISLTDACERSFRIDLSVKEGICSFMRKLLDLNEKDDFNRIVFGLMYVGGDDGVILLPSRLSIPFALNLLNEYYLNMGCRNALSIGIVASKPKHPLTHLYEACDSLLNIAKRARKDCYENLHKNALLSPSDAFRGALAFLTTDGGWTTSESVKSITEEAYSEGVSRMKDSYFLSSAQDEKSILKLLNVVEYPSFYHLDDLSPERLLEIVGEGKSIDEKERKVSRLRDVRNSIHDIFASSKLKVEPGKMEFIYTVKEAETAPSEVKRKLMKEMASQAFQKMNRSVNFNLYDLFLLVKLLGGGRL